MASQTNSFDIVSKVNRPELENALNQARREIDNRFDFKGTGSRIESGEEGLTVFSSDEYHLKAMIEVMETRLTRRKVPLKALSWKATADGPKGTVKREAAVLEGIDADKAREITKLVKGLHKKMNVVVQKEQVRVSSKSKDLLQEAMKAVREHDFGIPLQFTNYR
ncbi:MAG: YajQ family cyclic di-GMP-binding protein [Actinobacteria bacterium]|nr:YajQ family cyclic di-GMP-binding protein [Actinomycetota bacterium]MCG2819166.1 YajQ family cyclic di-GMP-binding protein [Actinomycetes bacterium]MBU4179127.1 YajQ family cyclic di-GMP-binding protein [Actinomycetota bacterium]MBU4219035.1 YajQ family cyclic di-GMP-binding protein [Actinomycetota bacterium]MBU4359223.1 YajQ family cyclic di-GMP-binding protein [Actinomycetota bacterium]